MDLKLNMISKFLYCNIFLFLYTAMVCPVFIQNADIINFIGFVFYIDTEITSSRWKGRLSFDIFAGIQNRNPKLVFLMFLKMVLKFCSVGYNVDCLFNPVLYVSMWYICERLQLSLYYFIYRTEKHI